MLLHTTKTIFIKTTQEIMRAFLNYLYDSTVLKMSSEKIVYFFSLNIENKNVNESKSELKIMIKLAEYEFRNKFRHKEKTFLG